MDTDKIKVIVGLDNITDYSANFQHGKEDFYEILAEVNADKDVMTVFNTIDDKIAFFTSGKDSVTEEKEFILFVAKDAPDLFQFFHDKYVEVMLGSLLSLDSKIRQRECNSIIMLSRCLVQLTDLNEDELLDKLKLADDTDN
jgi:hypothetical protein